MSANQIDDLLERSDREMDAMGHPSLATDDLYDEHGPPAVPPG
ncbi:hypothetical protein [Georgenia deserti]|uniref:Uncharacterized protein n=1 Tax=Georgenia deserti TaxID=2093781 RepID=A0ABW4L5U1_9MICO